MKTTPSPNDLRQRYRKLARQLAKTGLILQGTITERTITRPDPAHPEQNKDYGPYYQWTWKRQGKTVTVNLTAAQAKRCQKAIDEHRKIEKTLDEMEALSWTILEQTTKSVVRRKPKQTL
jgi:hypothetical protein